MKKVIIFTSLLFLSIIAVGQKQSISLQAGLNVSYSIGKSNGSSSLRLDPAGGVNYDIEIPEKLLLGIGMHYIPRGLRYPVSYTDENGSTIGEGVIDYNYDYLSFPIRVGIVKGSKVKRIYYVALVPSVLVSATVKSSDPSRESYQRKIKEPFSDYDLGLMVGIELVFPLRDGIALFPSLSFYQGLTNFNDAFDGYALRHWGGFIGFGFKYSFDETE